MFVSLCVCLSVCGCISVYVSVLCLCVYVCVCLCVFVCVCVYVGVELGVYRIIVGFHPEDNTAFKHIVLILSQTSMIFDKSLIF